MKSEVQIVEVAPWEGLQCETKYIAVDKKVELIKRISQSGIKRIIATSFAHPRFFPQFVDSEQVMSSLNCVTDTTYLAAVPNEIGCRRALASGVKEIAVWVSSSETHNVKSLKTSIANTMKEIQLISKICKENNVRIRSMIATAFGCIYEGEIPVAVVQEIALRLNKLGCDEVCLTDTHGVANPKEVRERIRHLRRELPHITFGVHFHDIRGMGMANVFVAFEEGIRIFDAAIGGIGAAPDMLSGSLDCPTEDLVLMFEEIGVSTGIELNKLSSCTDLAEEIIGRKLRK
jgi:hydroxymethylglutaryl-CoA lyase